MKKISFLVIGFCLIIMGCGKKNTTKEIPNKDTSKVVVVTIDSLIFEVDTFHVIENETKCPDGDCASFDVYYERIKTCLKPVHDSVNRYIDTFMLQALSGIGDDQDGYDLKKRARSFIQFKKDFEADNSESGGSWDWLHHTSIYRPVNEIITVSSGWGGYTGGAHSNYNSETVNFFTTNGKRVAMKDIFNDLGAVNKIGVKYFKKDNELDPHIDCSEQGWDFTDEEFTLNENFDITTESITWQFNAYEIGAYSDGAPGVKIPMGELNKYLKIKFTDVVIK